jgi:ABC-type uncharacterized transport system substrate-binding protein
VFASAADPVATGIVASLARPGGNVTGLSSQIPDSASKRIELLREVVSRLRRLAILANPDNSYVALEVREAQAAARTLDLEVALFEIRRAEDIAPAFEGLKGRAEALYVLPDTVLFTHRLRINTLALGARLPTMHLFREYVEASGALGWTAGRNLRIDYRWNTNNDPADIQKLAAELAALAPDVILASGNVVIAPTLRAARTTPIVLVQVIDPVGSGFVQSMAQPGGNVTGFTQFEYSLAGKWLELLKEIAPSVKRVAVVRDPTRGPGIGQCSAARQRGRSRRALSRRRCR